MSAHPLDHMLHEYKVFICLVHTCIPVILSKYLLDEGIA